METGIYLADTDKLKNPEIFNKYMAEVSEWRRKKAELIRSASGQRLSLAAGVLLCRALRDAGIDPGKAEITISSKGKPALVGNPSVHFNLSHSGTKAICMIGSFENGCDIEQVKEYRQKVAGRFFNEDEYLWIESHSDEEKAESFCRMWTMKESFVKVTGMGLSLDMHDFLIDLKGECPKISIKENLKTDGEECPGISSQSDGKKYFAREYRTVRGYAISCIQESAAFPEVITEVILE